MKCTMWAICGAGLLALAGAGCGGNGLNGPEDMLPSHPLDDGHLSGCSADDDCNDGNKCHTYHCNIVTHACANTDVQCSSTDPCNTSACDPSSGTCALMGANDGATCTDPTSGSDGTCLAGTCKPLPNCDNSQNTFLSLQCSNDSLRYDDNNNDPNGGFFDATNQTSDYSCAKGETSGEVGYPFFTTVGGPVTVTLHVTNPNDPASPDMAGADPDLDLIILDGACTEKAACMNPAIAGGGFQGITAGTGLERHRLADVRRRSRLRRVVELLGGRRYADRRRQRHLRPAVRLPAILHQRFVHRRADVRRADHAPGERPQRQHRLDEPEHRLGPEPDHCAVQRPLEPRRPRVRLPLQHAGDHQPERAVHRLARVDRRHASAAVADHPQGRLDGADQLRS